MIYNRKGTFIDNIKALYFILDFTTILPILINFLFDFNFCYSKAPFAQMDILQREISDE